jgi:hypothetical protein
MVKGHVAIQKMKKERERERGTKTEEGKTSSQYKADLLRLSHTLDLAS